MAAQSAREVVCEVCGYQHFLTPIPAACVLLVDAQERLLILRRAHEPGLGKWGLPGGVIEPGETGEFAAARELREEAGIEVAPEAFRYLVSLNNDYLFQDFLWPTVDLFFTARLEAAAVRADPREVSEARWCPLHEVPLAEFAFASNAQAVRVLRGDG
jgi:ADP-ribose pyrophosphatase